MEQIESFLKHWPRAVFCMLFGGLLGLIAWMYLPKYFTASVPLHVSMDYNRTGKLDNLEQERLIGIVEDILHSDSVMEKVYLESGMQDYRTFFNNTQTFRTNNDWRLSIRGRDPKKVGELTLFWLDTVYDSLYSHLSHAMRAEALQDELEGLTRCITNTGNAEFTAICDTDPAALKQNIEALNEEILTENKASGGISPAIIIGEKNPKKLEIYPVSGTVALCTLLGSFCGLLAAFSIVWFRRPGENA